MIHFDLPLPVGHELALRGFLKQMRKTEGEATLLSKRWDSDLHALRFTATGGPHTIRSSLFVRGFDGWAIYAGTLKNETIEPAELELAERAREHTRFGFAQRFGQSAGQQEESGDELGHAIGHRYSRNTRDVPQELSSR